MTCVLTNQPSDSAHEPEPGCKQKKNPSPLRRSAAFIPVIAAATGGAFPVLNLGFVPRSRHTPFFGADPEQIKTRSAGNQYLVAC